LLFLAEELGISGVKGSGYWRGGAEESTGEIGRGRPCLLPKSEKFSVL